jgi:uncharacterized repeat protein (TIGR03803 family)
LLHLQDSGKLQIILSLGLIRPSSELQTSGSSRAGSRENLPDLLGVHLKRVLLLLSCAAVFQYAIALAGLGQENKSSTAPDRSSASVGGYSRSSQARNNGVAGKGKGGHFRVDYTFKGENGEMPAAPLIEDAMGNLYGTTSSGGSSNLGVVFKLDTANNETVLHAFTGGTTDGATPYGGLVLDGSGNLYGTTYAGGLSGLGTVFKVDTSSTESLVHSFTGNPDGANPYAGLVMDNSGVLYGTTEGGGTSGFGTIFNIDTNGSETVLHSFGGGSTDGADPKARLILDAAGNLYGTTFTAGSGGQGTVFELDTTNTETVLYNFTGGADGGNPFGGLARDSSGILYGTAENGGDSDEDRYGCCKGVVFSLAGTSEKVLYNFSGGHDGGTPVADLLLHNGALYGTTLSGGPGNRGTAFSLTVATREETVLHGFTGGKDGGGPHAGLLINAAGALYGTAEKGGHFHQGTVFQISK